MQNDILHGDEPLAELETRTSWSLGTRWETSNVQGMPPRFVAVLRVARQDRVASPICQHSYHGGEGELYIMYIALHFQWCILF